MSSIPGADAPGAPLPPAPILLVDDREDSLLALEACLEPLGEPIVAVRSGEEALRWLLREQFAVILLDVYMPVMDGFTTAAHIKQLERTRHIPIIFLTAETGEERHVALGYETGAVDFLVKPFETWMLRSKVQVFLELHRKNRLLEAQARTLQARLEELADSRRVLAEAQRIAQIGNWDLEIASQTMRWSEQMRELFGVGPGPLPPVHEVFDFLEEALSGKSGDRFTTRSVITRPDGRRRTCVVRGELVRDADGDLVRVVGTHQDVTEYEASQQALAEAAQALEREHHVVKVLQSAMLPGHLPGPPGLELAARYLPAEGVGGDWYDAIWLPDGDTLLVIGDVAGRGVEAASLMNEVRISLRALAQRSPNPSSLLNAVNAYLRGVDDTAMVTCLVVRIDGLTGECTAASAGHLAPLVHDGDEPRFLELRTGPPLGPAFDGAVDCSFHLSPGGRLVLFTDGLVETRGTSIDVRLRELSAAAAQPAQTGEQLLDHVLAALMTARRPDDVAVLTAERRPGDALDVTVVARAANLSLLRAVLRRWLAGHGVDDVRARDLLLAAGEIMANACVHAYGFPTGDLRLEARLDGDEATIVVSDHGTWREPRDRQGGLGLELARTITDELRVDSGEHGTRVTLVARSLRPATVSGSHDDG